MTSGNKPVLGIIGGSGLYSLLTNSQSLEIKTPFSSIPITLQKEEFDDIIIYFLPRHGEKHSIPPHAVNYKANIYSLFKVGCQGVLSTNAVGSLHENIGPGSYVIIDQFIDFVRPITFFNGDFSVILPSGRKLEGVVHTDMSTPYDETLRQVLINAAEKKSDKVFLLAASSAALAIISNIFRSSTPSPQKVKEIWFWCIRK